MARSELGRSGFVLRRIGLVLAGAALAAFALLSVWYGGRAAWSDASSLQSRWLVSQWRAGEGPASSEAQWVEVRADLQAALQTSPDNAQLLDDLGFLNASRAQALGTPAAGSPAQQMQQDLLSEAVASYRAAARLRPTFPYTWAYLALAKHRHGEQDAELWLAFDKALHYGHAEAGVHPALAEIAFARWGALGAERQARFKAMAATSPAATRKHLLEMATRSGVELSAR